MKPLNLQRTTLSVPPRLGVALPAGYAPCGSVAQQIACWTSRLAQMKWFKDCMFESHQSRVSVFFCQYIPWRMCWLVSDHITFFLFVFDQSKHFQPACSQMKQTDPYPHCRPVSYSGHTATLPTRTNWLNRQIISRQKSEQTGESKLLRVIILPCLIFGWCWANSNVSLIQSRYSAHITLNR